MNVLIKLGSVLLGVVIASSTHALTINGLTFNAASGAVSLDSIAGSGTLADPYVLHETVSSADVIISIEGLSSHGNTTASGHASGFRLKKVITNNTTGDWSFYDNELQEVLGIASGDGDGLSFAQGSPNQRPFVGSPMSTVIEIDTARDYVNFSGGTVPIGGVLTVEYTITDNSPDDIFYLRQRPNIDFTGTPVPELGSTLGLLGLGIGGLGLLRRKLS